MTKTYTLTHIERCFREYLRKSTYRTFEMMLANDKPEATEIMKADAWRHFCDPQWENLKETLLEGDHD
jgi:hypothetical protein